MRYFHSNFRRTCTEIWKSERYNLSDLRQVTSGPCRSLRAIALSTRHCILLLNERLRCCSTGVLENVTKYRPLWVLSENGQHGCCVSYFIFRKYIVEMSLHSDGVFFPVTTCKCEFCRASIPPDCHN